VLGGRVMQPVADCEWHTNMPEYWLPLGLPGGEKTPMKKETDTWWLSETAFSAYLNGQLFEATSQGELFRFEDRVGLGIDHERRKNAEGLFYRAKFVRPAADVGLLVHTNLDVFHGSSGTVGVGGESRMGDYQVVDYALPKQSAQGRVKVILLTPAYFTGGFQPANGDWSAWLGQNAKLVSYSVGKPLAISGWDVANKRPKPLRHFVPAGSVFYFEDAVWQEQPFTENADSAPYSVMGFGATAVTGWNTL
jgi:CRISPR-associated protein Cmr3